MRIILRLALTLVLVAIAAFCCFGFMASGEAGPQGANAFRLIYGTLIVACVASLVAVWRVKPRRR
jgi:hypothetical protein